MQENASADKTILLTALAAVFCYGATPVFIRSFVTVLDPWTVNGVRYAVGCLFWLPFVLATPRSQFGSGRDSVWRDALIPSVINLAAQVGWGVSPYLISAPMMGFVYRFSFLWTVVLGLIFIREERRLLREPFFALGSMVCVFGVGMMFWERMAGGVEGSRLALAVVIATNIVFGGYAVSVRRCMARYSVRLSFGVISLYTAVGLLVLMPVFGRPATLLQISAGTWAMLVISALIGIAFAHVLYYRTIRRLGAIVSTGLLMASPFITAILARIFLREGMSTLQFVGGVALVGGGLLLLVAWAHAERRSLEAQAAETITP